MGLAQHLIGLADARGIAQENLEPSRGAVRLVSLRKHADVDAVGVADESIQWSAAEPVPPPASQVVADEDLRDGVTRAKARMVAIGSLPSSVSTCASCARARRTFRSRARRSSSVRLSCVT